MAIQIQMRRDTAANWSSNDPTLASGEIGLETDTGKTKIGDGSTAWTSLAYLGVSSHTLLDGDVHSDSVADDISRGSIIYGNATPKWDELVKGAADTFLGSDGTDVSYRTAAQVMASLSAEAGAAFDLNGQDLINGGVLFLTEQADAEADVEAKGQFWVKTATPNLPYFTDDAGTDFKLGGTIVNRGDVSGKDFELDGSGSQQGSTPMTTDGTYYDMDCSGVVPAGAKAIFLAVSMKDDATNSYIHVKEKGNTNEDNAGKLRTQAADVWMDGTLTVFCNGDRKLEYRTTNTTFTDINVTIMGWWT